MKKTASVFSAFLLLLCLILPANAASYLVPGGQVIGLHLYNDTVSVAAIDEELGRSAKEAGLKVGDRIVSVNGQKVTCSEDVKNAMQNCTATVDVGILRQGKTKKLTFCPVSTDKGLKLGVYLKQGVTGVGTVTYYDPQKNTFGALGHGVNDTAGDLLEMEKGDIFPASVLSVKKGKTGDPGQLMGAVTDTAPMGTLSKNTGRGVFGSISCPDADTLPVAAGSEVKEGPATIRSTVGGTALREYSVEILKIYPNAGEKGRNMVLKVTDPALLETTGGIVQGMSGSPIIQDGHLIGAVTHVLVNDPTTGYGIFIENMLNAAA